MRHLPIGAAERDHARIDDFSNCLRGHRLRLNTGVVANGQGSYIVAKQAATGFPGLGNLKADALAEANNYCRQQSQGQELFVTRATETQPPYLLGNYPRAEIEFRCGAPSAAADAATSECREKRKRGELKTYQGFRRVFKS